ncbi:MAG: pimeloyl-ACP methyl ester carboxylesterase [Halieaceae bacterium]|jgi:pimeloyl-ACP methyl ester carboxylesterase
MAVIKKRFAAVDGRVVHYRVAGAGLPVLLLHESPRSSRSLLPLLEALGDEFRVIAPDTPGYGSSTRLRDLFPELAEFSAALAGFLDAIGIQRCVLYGSHTGGSIAADFAERYPTRVAGLILDGFAIFTDTEKQDMVDSYLPPFEPRWDGAHITGLWSRVRDLFTYFPYHRRDPAHRITTETFSLDACYRTVLGFIEAGDHYRGGYRASITHDAQRSLLSLTVPATVVCRDGDLLRHHLERIPVQANCAKIAVPDGGDWVGTIRELVLRYGAGLPKATGVHADPWREGYLDLGDRQLRLRRFGTPGACPVLYLHDLPGCGADAQRLSESLGKDFLVVAPDLPSCADSDGLGDHGAGLEQLAGALLAVLDETADGPTTIVSQGAAVRVGALLHGHDRQRCPTHVANELGTNYLAVPPDSVRTLVPDSAPRLGGGHLIDAWFQLRDGFYYAPWYERGHAARRTRDPLDKLELLQSKFTAWLKGPEIEQLARLIVALPPPRRAPDLVRADADDDELAQAIKSLR